MKNFTIENDTNNITVHASAKVADTVLNSGRFSNEAALAKVVARWPLARLVEIWNSLPGETPVKKFKDRRSAVSRIWKAIQSLGQSTPAARAEKVHAGTNAGAPRQGSKTSQVIAMLKRERGTTLDEIMTATGWQKHTTRAMLSAGGPLTKKHGLVIISEKLGDQRIYSIKA